MIASTRDLEFMQLALLEAQKAAEAGEVPVGAVVVKDGRVIATGRNAPISNCDPTAHAEIVALRAAAKVLGNYRLDGCEMFVTLEPCSMCSGAILHARLKRLIFGATDAKTGAVGSVLNLFEQSTLNHQTDVVGDVHGDACSALIKSFFQAKRADHSTQKLTAHPLRDDAVRTPEAQFLDLPDYPWPANYINDLPVLDGLRMHYLDEGPANAPRTYFCLHGHPTWSYAYRKMMPVLRNAGHRVVTPDLVGFGKSDKPKRMKADTFAFHQQCLLQLIERLNLHNIVLVVQDWSSVLGLTLPFEMPERFFGVVVINPINRDDVAQSIPELVAWQEAWTRKSKFDIAALFARIQPQLTSAECSAYAAPYPANGFCASTRAFPEVATHELSDEFWQKPWQGPSLLVSRVNKAPDAWASVKALSGIHWGHPPPGLVADDMGLYAEPSEALAHAILSAMD